MPSSLPLCFGGAAGPVSGVFTISPEETKVAHRWRLVPSGVLRPMIRPGRLGAYSSDSETRGLRRAAWPFPQANAAAQRTGGRF